MHHIRGGRILATPIEKTITLRTYGYGEDTVGYPPHGLVEAIDALQEAFFEIPTEYRESAEVDFSAQWEHGETFDRIRITYSRLETQEEADARELQERQATLKWIEEQETLIRRRKAELGI
jgi:hypothetical protein